MDTLEISEWGRPIVWLMQWSHYGGQAFGWCAYSTKDEAIKHAIFEAKGNVDWETFPDPAKKYPDDDRDSTYPQTLTPLFRVTWGGEGGGYAQVTKTEIEKTFGAADYAMAQVEHIFKRINREKSANV
jgi:hypothetical protein